MLLPSCIGYAHLSGAVFFHTCILKLGYASFHLGTAGKFYVQGKGLLFEPNVCCMLRITSCSFFLNTCNLLLCNPAENQSTKSTERWGLCNGIHSEEKKNVHNKYISYLKQMCIYLNSCNENCCCDIEKKRKRNINRPI